MFRGEEEMGAFPTRSVFPQERADAAKGRTLAHAPKANA